MGSGLLRKRNGDSAGATGATGGGVLRTVAGNGGACEGSRCAYWCRVGRYCARLLAMEGPVRAPSVLTGVRLRALRTVAGNGGAWDGIRCAYRCPVEGIAHGCRQLRGLRWHPVCLPVSG